MRAARRWTGGDRPIRAGDDGLKEERKERTGLREAETAVAPEVKAAVWERDGHGCILCGSPFAAPDGRLFSPSQGGPGIPENTVTLCFCCRARSTTVRNRRDPRTAPAVFEIPVSGMGRPNLERQEGIRNAQQRDIDGTIDRRPCTAPHPGRVRRYAASASRWSAPIRQGKGTGGRFHHGIGLAGRR